MNPEKARNLTTEKLKTLGPTTMKNIFLEIEKSALSGCYKFVMDVYDGYPIDFVCNELVKLGYNVIVTGPEMYQRNKLFQIEIDWLEKVVPQKKQIKNK